MRRQPYFLVWFNDYRGNDQPRPVTRTLRTQARNEAHARRLASAKFQVPVDAFHVYQQTGPEY